MIRRDQRRVGVAGRPLFVRPAEWAIFAAPRGVLPFYLATMLTAIVLAVVVPGPAADVRDWVQFGALLAIGVTQTELSRGTEQVRRWFADMAHINMTSVWFLPGGMLLPPLLAALLVVVTYGYLWWRVRRPRASRPAYIVLFSGATAVLSALSVAPVLRLCGIGGTLEGASPDVRTLGAVVTAIFVYTGVNSVLIMTGIKLHNPARAFLPLIGSWADNALELGTLCLGGITAIVLITYPLMTPLMLLPLVALHRCVLMKQLQQMATEDAKTGLLTDREWRNRAEGELARAEHRHEPFCVCIVDLDRFKLINDTHGHLTGDAVLRAVADTIRAEVRAYDSVGRFGGEEFVVLLPDISETGGRAIAERVRQAIAGLEVVTALGDRATVIDGLSASIGIATCPDAGLQLDRLLHAADMAMYRAKALGRNRVVCLSDPIRPSC